MPKMFRFCFVQGTQILQKFQNCRKVISILLIIVPNPYVSNISDWRDAPSIWARTCNARRSPSLQGADTTRDDENNSINSGEDLFFFGFIFPLFHYSIGRSIVESFGSNDLFWGRSSTSTLHDGSEPPWRVPG